jgi:hypothetical protein
MEGLFEFGVRFQGGVLNVAGDYSGTVITIDPDTGEVVDVEFDAAPFVAAGVKLTMIENLELALLFKFDFPQNDDGEGLENQHIAMGLGANYTMGDFGIGARLAANIAKDYFGFGIDILPSYDLGFMKFFLNAGFGFGSIKDVDDAMIGLQINPYILKQVGGGSFYAGFKFELNSWGDWSDSKWAIPVGMIFNF